MEGKGDPTGDECDGFPCDMSATVVFSTGQWAVSSRKTAVIRLPACVTLARDGRLLKREKRSRWEGFSCSGAFLGRGSRCIVCPRCLSSWHERAHERVTNDVFHSTGVSVTHAVLEPVIVFERADAVRRQVSIAHAICYTFALQ